MNRRGESKPATLSPVAPWDWLDPHPHLGFALIFLLALTVYWPALNSEFIWDDSGHVTPPQLVSLGGLARIWFDIGATQQYYPLLHSAFWLEFQIWGETAWGYHLVSVVEHASAACLFVALLRRLAIPGAWLAAFIFVLHPVCVESVAWISEQKNTLSTILYLCSVLTYLRFVEDRRPARYTVATLLFVLALCSKTVTASLPAALLVIAWWSRGRLTWREDVRPLLPWFALSLGFGALSAWVEHDLIGAQGAAFSLSALERCLVAGRVVWFYLGKLIWPANLIFIYPRWTINAAEAWQYFPLLAAIAAVGIAAWFSRRSRTPLAVMLLFGGTLFPVLGFVNVYPFKFSYVADHFQYLAALAIFALIAAGVARAATEFPRWLANSFCAGLGLVLGILAWRQASTYRDAFTLYGTTLERNPVCWMAHNNLAVVLTRHGRVAEALVHAQESLRLLPDNAQTENTYGSCLVQLGRVPEAIVHFQRALKLQPRFPSVLTNLGIAYAELEKFPAAIASFESSLKLDPYSPFTHYHLGVSLARSGRLPEATTHFQSAMRLDPTSPEAEFKWGTALMFSDHFPEAVVHFERALKLAPDLAEYHTLYAYALAKQGRLDDAISHYRKVVELEPESSEAHMNLSIVLRQSGELREAALHSEEATRLKAVNRQ